MTRFLSIALALVTSTALADFLTIAPEGIDSEATGLDGTGIQIGMAEDGRSGKHDYDDPGQSASNTIPAGVYFQNASGMASENAFVTDHATWVAGVAIGKKEPNFRFEGVAPNAQLHSIAIEDFGDDSKIALALNRLALLNGGAVKAINMSFIRELQPFIESTDGNSHVAQFVDWSALRHDVLYVVIWGNSEHPDFRTPQDNYNGITVAASELAGDPPDWSRYWFFNALAGDADGDRTSIDILAPGSSVEVMGFNDQRVDVQGTSFAAPHVLGATAQLHQYAQKQMGLDPPNPRFTSNSERHEVMKAILLNSADKIEDVHGSRRTILDLNNNNWTQSEAFSNDEIPLDDQMGAGHLNVRRAVQQLTPGEYDPTEAVPLIGWDFHSIGGSGASNQYTFDSNFAGDYLAATLVWDRRTEHTGGNTYNEGDQFFNRTIDQSLNNLDLYLMPLGSDDLSDAIAASTSTVENVEHIFFNVPSSIFGYKLVVHHNGGIGNAQFYALSWWFGDAPVTAGDFNSDGNVDSADYVVWRKNGGPAQDYDDWFENFGSGSGSGSFDAVPEPAAFVMLAMVIPCLLSCRRLPRATSNVRN